MHLIATNFYGGPEKQILEHLKRLNAEKYTAVLASFCEKNGENELLDRAKSADIKTCEIRMTHALDFRALMILLKKLKRENIDLLCVHGYKSVIMGWYARKKLGIPVLVFSRGYTAEDRKVAFYEWLERQFLSKLDGIISVSKGQQKKLHAFGVKARKEWIVYNAVEIPEQSLNDLSQSSRNDVCSRLGVSPEKKLVVTAGRLSMEKGHRYLVEAIAKMGDKAKGINFVFCGSGPEQESLQEQSRKLGVGDKCYFVGFRRDIPDIFRVMDLFVLPSLTEGLPNVILEAFACKKPVISTCVGGVPELVTNDKNGLLIEACNPGALAIAMEKCIQSEELLHDLGESGFQTVREDFTFARQSKLTEQIYAELVK